MEDDQLHLCPCEEIYIQNRDLFEDFENYLNWQIKNQKDSEEYNFAQEDEQ